MKNRIRHYTKSRLFWPFAALILILLFDLLFIPGFFRLEIKEQHLYGRIIDILNRGAPLMLMALGMTFVIATEGVDLSVGAIVAIAGAVAAMLIGAETGVTRIPLLLVILLTLGGSMLCGLWNGVLVANLGIQPMVATLILMVSGRGIAKLITKGQILTIYYDPYSFFGGGYFLGLPVSLYVVAAAAVAAYLLARKTSFGLYIEAVGISSGASFHSGVNEKRVKQIAYILSGLCAGIAGILISSNTKSADSINAGVLAELNAILSVVIGGTLMTGGRFSLLGSLIGALIIQSLTTTIYAFGVPPTVVSVVKAIVVLLVCLIQSEVMHQKFNQWLKTNRNKVVTS
ncbi:MAG: ABC transporter permease [Anaerolineales bacterium]|nr:ABC transporter permease [Anaerolineales bacterium]